MITKNYMNFFALMMCLGFLVPGTTYGMNAFKQRYQTFKQNFTWKKAALAGIAGGCTLAEYRLGLSDYLTLVQPHYVFVDFEEDLLKSDNVDPIVDSFVRKHLMENGLTDQKNLKIKCVFSDLSELAHMETKNYKWLLVKPDRANGLARILNTPNSECNIKTIKAEFKDGYIKEMSFNDAKKETIAILHHEAGHIKNEDLKKRKYVVIGIPLSIATTSYLLRKKILPVHYFWINNSAKLLSGLSIGKLSAISYYQFNQYRELKADDNINDNMYLLGAMKQKMEDDILHGDQRSMNESRYNKLLKFHPDEKIRVERLKERIKRLKEKGDPKAFEDPLIFKENAEIK